MGVVKCVFLLLCLSLSTRGVFPSKVSDAFEDAEISPDVIENAPHEFVKVVYGEKHVKLGTNFEIPEVAMKPKFAFDGHPNRYYTLIMIDLDAPFPGLVTLPGQVLHWLVTNIEGSDMCSGDEKAFYLPPTPPPLSDPHRYVFVVYEQRHRIQFNLGDIIGTTAERPVFHIDKFVQEHHLDGPKYGNFFYCSNFI